MTLSLIIASVSFLAYSSLLVPVYTLWAQPITPRISGSITILESSNGTVVCSHQAKISYLDCRELVCLVQIQNIFSCRKSSRFLIAKRHLILEDSNTPEQLVCFKIWDASFARHFEVCSCTGGYEEPFLHLLQSHSLSFPKVLLFTEEETCNETCATSG